MRRAPHGVCPGLQPPPSPAWGTSFRIGTSPSWWRRSPISGSCSDTFISTPCGARGVRPPAVDRYPWCGHAGLLGGTSTLAGSGVRLGLVSDQRERPACRAYRAFCAKASPRAAGWTWWGRAHPLAGRVAEVARRSPARRAGPDGRAHPGPRPVCGTDAGGRDDRAKRQSSPSETVARLAGIIRQACQRQGISAEELRHGRASSPNLGRPGSPRGAPGNAVRALPGRCGAPARRVDVRDRKAVNAGGGTIRFTSEQRPAFHTASISFRHPSRGAPASSTAPAP